jgi:integrase/recombinase XerD
MVKVLLYSGLRVSELLSLSKDSIVKVRGRAVLRVLGKGGKERFIPLPKELAEELSEYSRNLEEKERLFPLSYSGVRYILRRISRECGVKLHPHKLRHTFATMLVDAGVDIRVIQAFLGHASPSTSARYAKVRDDVMFSVVEKIFGTPP